MSLMGLYPVSVTTACTTATMSVKRIRPFQKSRHGHFIGRVENRRADAPPPAGFQGQGQAGETFQIRISEGQRTGLGQFQAGQFQRQAPGERQSVSDGQPACPECPFGPAPIRR